jgi:hypothetical protein
MGLGSGIRNKTYSGSRIRVNKAPDPGSRIRNTDKYNKRVAYPLAGSSGCVAAASAAYAPTPPEQNKIASENLLVKLGQKRLLLV